MIANLVRNAVIHGFGGRSAGTLQIRASLQAPAQIQAPVQGQVQAPAPAKIVEMTFQDSRFIGSSLHIVSRRENVTFY